ncbi:MAG: hypothetical protein M3P08_16420 [Thermoproteota archaeon]|nr:hypothetical protein [Thermoproteota archaeon]
MCPKCKNQLVWRCEECKGVSRKYSCIGCGYSNNKSI